MQDVNTRNNGAMREAYTSKKRPQGYTEPKRTRTRRKNKQTRRGGGVVPQVPHDLRKTLGRAGSGAAEAAATWKQRCEEEGGHVAPAFGGGGGGG